MGQLSPDTLAIPHLSSLGRAGKPKRRLLWLDVSSPSDALLVWHDGDAQVRGRVKSKDQLRIVDIGDIRRGRTGDVLMRSGRDEAAGCYMSFAGPQRTLDIELPTEEALDWLFNKFIALFHAYAAAHTEDRSGSAITSRVHEIVDLEPVAAAAAEEEAARRAAKAARSVARRPAASAGLPFSASTRR